MADYLFRSNSNRSIEGIGAYPVSKNVTSVHYDMTLSLIISIVSSLILTKHTYVPILTVVSPLAFYLHSRILPSISPSLSSVVSDGMLKLLQP